MLASRMCPAMQRKRTCHPCLPGWIEFNSTQKCYYFSTERKNWMDSRSACKNLDADLVTIKNTEEQAFISQNAVVYTSMIWEGYWIGLTDAAKEGTWVWVDSTLMTTPLWHYLEPNNVMNEDCATTTKTPDPSQSWYDASCSNSYRWICETKALKGSN
ncbi:CD209 antigen-like protein C [Megalops cyprinoides]|uniref:CD209 antigen-like protein C n=1 Tax=Megalops cyprinoides TaxID=118141 RepID=UPI001863F57B|nr:CD209 antigen-like protein C [Megalops cyprinoides]